MDKMAANTSRKKPSTANSSSNGSRGTNTGTGRTVKKSASSSKRKVASAPKGFALEIVGVLVIALGIIYAVFFYTNATGVFGLAMSDFFKGIFGTVAYVLPIVTVILGVYLLKNRSYPNFYAKLILSVLIMAFLSAFFQIFVYDSSQSSTVFDFYALGKIGHGGGYIGALIANPLVRAIDKIATGIILFILTIILFTVATKISIFKVISGFFSGVKEHSQNIREEQSYNMGQKAGSFAANTAYNAQRMRKKKIDFPVGTEVPASFSHITPEENKLSNASDEIKLSKSDIGKIGSAFEEAESLDDELDIDDIMENVSVFDVNEVKRIIAMEKGKTQALQTDETVEDNEEDEEIIPAADESMSIDEEEIYSRDIDENSSISHQETDEIIPPNEVNPLDLGVSPLDMPIMPSKNENPIIPEGLRVQITKDEVEEVVVPQPVLIPYTFPSVNLLALPQIGKNEDAKAELRQNATKLVETLKSFGVEVQLLQVSRGPTVTRYELAPKAGVKVSKITGLSDDIALNLAATAVRIEAPIPGKAAIGIEIPNKITSTVSMREVITTSEFVSANSKLSVALGMDITGNPIIGDIGRMPHVLIAGATGSGKSVCINTLITSIIYKSDPNEVKLIMIDPKVVELGIYNGIPHLLIPVVTEPKRAAGALNWAVQEMTKRYNLFAENAVRDLKGYNTLIEEKMGKEYRLPQIVIIIDELADLMMVAPNEVEESICRLAQMARAAGMHLVIATQRPSVDVITGVIKANIPSRIAFAVSSQVDSRTILDMVGAEKLLGKGDMLYYPMGASKPVRVQGAFVSDKEIEEIVEFIKKASSAIYDEDVLENIAKGTSSEATEKGGGDADELLPAAIEMAIEAGQISTSLVQRRLKLGYARAGRIIDQMEARGIITGFEGSKPRQTKITREQWNAMK